MDPQTADPILTVGEYTYGTPNVLYWGDATRVSIGKFCSIAGNVTIFAGGNHRADWITTYPLRMKLNLPGAARDGCPASRGDVIIGSDVWLGQGSAIMSGVEIGDGAVVAAFAVVTKSVPLYAIVGGNPAKEIARRFGEDQIRDLLEIQWWNWPMERILSFVDLLSSPDIDRFIAAAKQEG